MPAIGDLRADLRHVTLDALRPVAAGLAVLFSAFIVFNVVDLSKHALIPCSRRPSTPQYSF